MLIDIHRHSGDIGVADIMVRNLYHNQSSETDQDNWFTIGLHPWQIDQGDLLRDLKMVKESARLPRIIAIGECGLDKAIDTPFEVQKEAFRYQLDVALETDKPVIIHCVRAYNEIMEARQEVKHRRPWIIHWFNASLTMAKQLISKGFYLSFGHMLFNEGSKAFKAFPDIPVGNIFFETDDAGYNIREIYEKAAELKKVRMSHLENIIRNNFINCFGFEP